MKKWLRPPMLMMTVLSLFAMVMPSLVWSCPVTGRTGNMATICARPSDDLSSATPSCCATQKTRVASCLSRCCTSVPQPADSDGEKSSLPARSHINAAALIAQSLAVPTIVVTFALPSAPLLIEPSPTPAFGASNITPLLAQDAPAALVGRAPPLS